MKTRDNAVSLFKFLASILVIYMHTSPLHPYSKIINYYIINYVGRVAVLFFFVTSGYYLFGKEITKEKIKSYVKKSIILYFVWMLLYVPVFIYESSPVDIKMFFLIFIKKIVLNNTHLWYLEALIISVVLVYFLGQLMNRNYRSVFIISLPFAIVGVALLSYQGFVLQVPYIEKLARIYYFIFGEAPNALLVGFPYIALGAMIRHNEVRSIKKIRNSLLISMMLLFIEVTVIGFLDCAGGSQEVYFLSIPTTAYIFLFVKNLQLGNDRLCNLLENISVNVYFVHQLFRAVYKAFVPSQILNFQFNGIICFLFTTVLSVAFAYAMFKIKDYRKVR